MGEELATQSLALTGATHVPAMSTNCTVAGSNLAEPYRSANFCSRGSGTPTMPTFGLDGGEGVVGGERASLREGVEQGGLADVRKADDTDCQGHPRSVESARTCHTHRAPWGHAHHRTRLASRRPCRHGRRGVPRIPAGAASTRPHIAELEGRCAVLDEQVRARGTIDATLQPLQQAMAGLTQQVDEAERARVAAIAGLSERLLTVGQQVGEATRDVQAQAQRITQALSRTQKPGRSWGEMQLRRIVEAMG